MSAFPFKETEFAPRTFANILADARTVKPDQLDIVSALVNECADLGPIEQNAVMRAIKDATGILRWCRFSGQDAKLIPT